MLSDEVQDFINKLEACGAYSTEDILALVQEYIVYKGATPTSGVPFYPTSHGRQRWDKTHIAPTEGSVAVAHRGNLSRHYHVYPSRRLYNAFKKIGVY